MVEIGRQINYRPKADLLEMVFRSILEERRIHIDFSLMTIILGSIGTRKILTLLKSLWERLVEKNDN